MLYYSTNIPKKTHQPVDGLFVFDCCLGIKKLNCFSKNHKKCPKVLNKNKNKYRVHTLLAQLIRNKKKSK